MNAKLCFLFVLIMVALQCSLAKAQVTGTPKEIQSYVDKRGGRKNYPTEINKLVMGDLNGDGKEDAVVQYNIQEGYPGNYFSSYIAVFLNKNGRFVFTTEMNGGTKLTSGIVPSEIRNKRIMFDRYAANIPKKLGTVSYKLVGRKLVKSR